MVAQPKHDDTMSVAEYFDLLRETDNVKYELIDGTVYAMAGAKPPHQAITSDLNGIFYNATRGTPCRHFDSDTAIHAASANFFFPDLTVVCGDPIYVEDAPIGILTNPTVIVEVLSETTENTDRTTKFDHYRQIATLQDYVLVWQDEPRIDVFSRGESDTWLLTHATELEAAIALPSLSVTLALSEVYQRVTFGAEENTAANTDSDTAE